VTVVLNATINLTIKFSPDAETAKKTLLSILLRVASWAAVLYACGSIVVYGISGGPVTRSGVVAVVINAMTLMIALLYRHLSEILRLMRRSMELYGTHFAEIAEVQRKHLTLTERVVDHAASRDKESRTTGEPTSTA
jgi:hypothetical protein